MRKAQSIAARKEQHWAWLMVAPTIIGLLVLNYYPLIETFILSFSKTKTFGASTFNGIDNYIQMFQSPEFWKATWNTILFCILTVPVGIILALLVALLLNAKVKFKGGFRAIYFLPMVCAPAAIAMVWRWMFNGEYGYYQSDPGHQDQLADRPQDRHCGLRHRGHLELHRLRRRAAAVRIAEYLQELL
mgnify:CR=1 FL=1